MTMSILIPFIAALSGAGCAALVTGLFQSPRTKAEAKKLVAESGDLLDKRWQAWAQTLEAKIATLETKLAEKDAQMTNLAQSLEREKWVTRLVISWALDLRDEIRRMGGEVQDPPLEVQAYIDELHPWQEPDA